MKLLDLEPEFIRREIRPCHVGAPDCNTVSEHTEHECYFPVDHLEDADGIMFLCPLCFNGSSVGVHRIICWRPRVPADVAPKPGRWEFRGTGLSDLTLEAGSGLSPPCAVGRGRQLRRPCAQLRAPRLE